MEEKYFNRYRSFCRSLRNLKKSKSADPAAEFVLEGTIQNYNLTFDLAWKVMKDILLLAVRNLIITVWPSRVMMKENWCTGFSR